MGDSMSTGYAVAYALGVTPWEQAGTEGATALDERFAWIEHELGGPGRALDLGCGSGLHLVGLARRGWSATGVDAVGGAVRRARNRAAAAGVGVNVVRGDVTDLDPTVIGTGYSLLLDIGCFHGLSDAARLRMGRSVTCVSDPGALMVVLAFKPGSAPKPLPRGADAADIEIAYPGWRVVDVAAAPTDGMPKRLRKTAPAFYTVRRTG